MVNKRERMLLTMIIILVMLLIVSIFNRFEMPSGEELKEPAVAVDGMAYNDKNESGLNFPDGSKGDEDFSYIEWETLETDHVILYLTNEIDHNYNYIYEDAEKVIGELEVFFGESLRHKIPVFIHSGESYLIAHRFANYNFDMTYGRLSNEAIVINVADFEPIEQADLRLIFAHEMAHAYIHHIYGFYSINENWFHEGLAEFIARHKVNYSDIHADHYMGLSGSIHRNFINVFQNLDQYGVHFTPDDIIIFKDSEIYEDYFIYESIIYYMYANYGEEKLFKFIEEFSKLSTTSNPKNSDYIIQKVFGISEIDMVEDWKNYYLLK
ncbi:hypothetical protein ACLIA0_14545 [Bacillaceae bacterium W0354]